QFEAAPRDPPAVPREPPAVALAAIALLPFVVWLVYGSVDWFWEFPALSGPALGFMGMAAAIATRRPAPDAAATEPHLDVAPASTSAGTPSSTGSSRPIGFAASAFGVLALLAAVVVLGFSYLAVRETSIASDLSQGDPGRALHALSIAADLNPLSADPGRLAGTIALTSQRYETARQRFEQAISRDPDGWYAWFGVGLAASAMGSRAQARRDFQAAASMNPREPAIRRALADLDSRHPLPPATALQLLSSV
ncbi:MAG TPA: tetratricopeptide repeat protein, partial [Solirubrobacteraceae bacterium]|nr:tetratricopeptide repeat protein [Solirubrobacteraceae bacterium]